MKKFLPLIIGLLILVVSIPVFAISLAPRFPTSNFQFYFQEGQRVYFSVQFAASGRGTGPVKFEVIDASNSVVKEICSNPRTIGMMCSWDGKASDGTFSPLGMYRIKVSYGRSYSRVIYSGAFESSYAP